LSSGKLVSRSFPSKEQKMLKSIKTFLKNTKQKKCIRNCMCRIVLLLAAKKKEKKCQLICVYAYSFNAGSAAILFRNASALVNGTFGRYPGSLKGDMYFFGLFFNLWPMCL